MTTDHTALVDRHLTAFGEPDRARREALVAQNWAQDGLLVDPPLQAAGHAAIADLTDALLGQFAGHRFERTSGVDAHNDALRYGWALVAPDGTRALEGVDVAQVAPDGRLQRITGFFGPLPEA